MAEDPESIARRLLQLRRLSKQLALTPDAEATYRALEQAKNAGAAPQWVQYLTDRLAFEVGNADQPPELPSESKSPRSKSTNPPALTEAKLESPPALSLAQSIEAEQSEPFPPTLETESDPFLGLDAQSPAPANSLFVHEEQSESEESSEGQHQEQQPQARPLLDRLPAEIRDTLTGFGLPGPSLPVQDPPSSELPKKAEPLPPKPEPVEQSKEQTGTELALASVAPKPKQSRKRGAYNSQIRNCARKVVEQAYGDARPVKGEAKKSVVKKKLADTYQKMASAKLLPSTEREPSWSTYERELGWRDVEK
jgi:hypothetical protein